MHRFASFRCFMYAQMYSTGFSSGAWAASSPTRSGHHRTRRSGEQCGCGDGRLVPDHLLWPVQWPVFGLRGGLATSVTGRVEMWRGGSRFGLSVAASFVWRCPSNLALTPFPHRAHRTGHADLPHSALGQEITPSHTAGSQPWTSQTHETEVPVEVLRWISPAPATSNLVLVA